MYALIAEHISKGYKSGNRYAEVLRDVTMQIDKGELVAIMGQSGSGKSTLLNVLSGIDVAESGKVIINGKCLAELSKDETALFRRRHIGMIFQDFQLLESLSVRENILLPMILDKKDLDDQEKASSGIMDAIGISGLADKAINDISGGERQRVAIARALVNGPDIIFGDEPTGNLDIKSTVDVMRCIIRMNREFNASFLIVTHDAYVASFCDRVLLLKDGILASEVRRQEGSGKYREDILKMLRLPGGDQDDIF